MRINYRVIVHYRAHPTEWHWTRSQNGPLNRYTAFRLAHTGVFAHTFVCTWNKISIEYSISINAIHAHGIDVRIISLIVWHLKSDRRHCVERLFFFSFRWLIRIDFMFGSVFLSCSWIWNSLSLLVTLTGSVDMTKLSVRVETHNPVTMSKCGAMWFFQLI